MTSRRTLLLALVLAAVAALAWQLRPVDEGPAGTAAPPSNPAGGAAAAAPGPEDPTDVKLELLHDEVLALTEASRNPFRFEEAPPPPPPPPGDLQPERPPEFSPPVPAGPPPPAPIPLRFIGYVARGGTMTATFSDGRGNTFLGREGDIIEGRYKVLRVGTDSVELAYLDGRGRQTIRLSGQ